MKEVYKFQCMACEHVTFGDQDGLRCSECHGPLAPLGYASPGEVEKYRRSKKSKHLTVDVSVKDTEVFKSVIGIMWQMVTDERIPADIRMHYARKVEGLTLSGG